jgi:hypothetical protein|tara:strand:- start:685 stop:921 length:237 start_codon:yes stop_codon:yes gene_type:complete
MGGPNFDRGTNEKYITSLVSKHGYIDRGWSNGGADFKGTIDPVIGVEEIDCSLYENRGTNIVYVNHLSGEILHVDMSD